MTETRIIDSIHTNGHIMPAEWSRQKPAQYSVLYFNRNSEPMKWIVMVTLDPQVLILTTRTSTVHKYPSTPQDRLSGSGTTDDVSYLLNLNYKGLAP